MKGLEDIGTKLDELAVAMLEEAAKESTTIDRKLDAFKVVQQYYLSAKKLRPGGGSGNEPPTPTMADLRSQVAAGGGDAAEPQGDSDEQADTTESD